MTFAVVLRAHVASGASCHPASSMLSSALDEALAFRRLRSPILHVFPLVSCPFVSRRQRWAERREVAWTQQGTMAVAREEGHSAAIADSREDLPRGGHAHELAFFNVAAPSALQVTAVERHFEPYR